jgi:alpha-L-fucosidase
MPASTTPWSHPLIKRGKLGSPLVEVTPFVFRDRLYRLENWQMQWEFPGSADGTACQQDQVRIRDLATGTVVATPLTGYGLGLAFVWEDRVHVFAGHWGAGAKWNITEIALTTSTDLTHWTTPEIVLRASPDEKLFNVGVCRGDGKFVLLVESNDPRWPPFTFKYFTSTDLRSWQPVPDAIYGHDKYVGGPALYHEGGWYYTLYLEALSGPRYETRVTRSRDLVHWTDAPAGRPFLTFDTAQPVHPLRSTTIRESNASDAELCFWQGRTLVYFTGGDQQVCGDLRWAEFNGTPRELLEAFYR